MSDLRYALRSVVRRPATSLLIVLTVALGIGANTSIFSIVNGVLLRPLPYADADRIVVVQETVQQGGESSNAPANFLDLRRRSRALSHLAGYARASLELTELAEPVSIDGAHVTAAFFEVFGVPASVGRAFGEKVDRPGDAPRAVLSHALWQERFAGRPEALGQLIHLSGRAYMIVGVMPSTFSWPADTRVWVSTDREVPPSPLDIPGELTEQREVKYFDVVGRLAAGASLEQARAEADAIAQGLARQYARTNAGVGFRIRTIREFLVGDVQRALLVLLAAVALVLLIACANIASLLIARAVDRQREVAVRAALGAGRGRLVRAFLAESLILAGLGGVLALAVSALTLDLLVQAIPETVPRTGDITLDLRVAAFTTLVTLVAGLLFGLAPVTHLRESALQGALKSGGGRTAGSEGVSRIRRMLVAGEVALSLVLLVAAALMGNSLWRLTSVDVGFQTGQVTAVALPLPTSRYPTLGKQSAFYRDVIERLRRSPSTADSAITFPLPLRGNGAAASFEIEGRPSASAADEPRALLSSVSPGYFKVMGVQVLMGRDFAETDAEHSPPVAIINRAMARRYFPKENPIGRRLVFGDTPDDRPVIVGVVSDIRREALDRPPEPTFFIPYSQFALPFMNVLVRSSADQAAVVAAVTRAVRDVDRNLAIGRVTSMEELRNRAAAQPRFRTIVLSTFAIIALLLASIGVYGVLASSVSQRARELGVRIALGAKPRDVYRLVVGEGARLAVFGLLAGLAVAAGLTRTLDALLYEVSASDPVMFGGASFLLLAVAAVASYVPARRATRVDPISALRCD
jgi:predicted permease